MWLALLLVTTCEAHNWLSSMSRSPAAATTRPVVPSTTNKPHATVAPGQRFHIEFTTGHGGSTTYLFVQKLSDQGKLGRNTKQDAVKLLFEQPPPGQDVPLRGEFRKRYRRLSDSLDAPAGDNFFRSKIKWNDAGYVRREPNFGPLGSTKVQPLTDDMLQQIVQLEYQDVHLEDDRRFTFYDKPDPRVPWILEFRRYVMHSEGGDGVAFVEFEFPVGTPLGDYMIYYNFHGYYDAVDVRVVADPVELVYGPPPPVEKMYENPEYTRIDHCAFNVNRVMGSCAIVLSNLDGCFNMCNRFFYSQCTGVMVFPGIPPAGSLNVTLYHDFILPDIIDESSPCPLTLLDDVKPGQMICAAVFANLPTQTEGRFRTTTDPIAPEFHSTCHIRQVVTKDEEAEPEVVPMNEPVVEKEWRHERECASCKAVAAAKRKQQLWVDWSLNKPEVCVNCQLEPIDPVSLPKIRNWTDYNPWSKFVADRMCDGKTRTPFPVGGGPGCAWPREHCHPRRSHCFNYCKYQLHFLTSGSGDIPPVDCAMLARLDPYCDDQTIVRGTRQNVRWSCTCWPKVPSPTSCCDACNSTGKTNFNQWGIFSVRPDLDYPTGPLGGNDALL